MKKMRFLLSQLFLLALLMTPFMVTSCDDDEPFVGVSGIGLQDGDKVFVGQEVDLKAQLSSLEGDITYLWTVNGEEVDKDEDYTFMAEKKGTYTIGLTATATNGVFEKNVTVDAILYPSTFYVVNEGQFNKTKGNYNLYVNGEWTYNLVEGGLGNTSTTGVIAGDFMYVVSKSAPFLAKINLKNNQIVDRLDEGLGRNGQGNYFCTINNEIGVLSTSNGAFKVNLNNLKEIEKLAGFENVYNDKEDVFKAGDHVFIASKNVIKVYNAQTLAFVKDLAPEVKTGFVQSKDGSLWGANENKLVKINVKTLETEEITIPNNLSVYYNSTAYTPCSMATSVSENALYFAEKTGSKYDIKGKNIYKYDIDKQTASLFFEIPQNDISVYGKGINVNPNNGEVYLVYMKDGWGPNSMINTIFVADGITGNQKAFIDYSGTYWFPSMIVFQ